MYTNMAARMHAFWASKPVTPQHVQSPEDEDVEVLHVQSVSLEEESKAGKRVPV